MKYFEFGKENKELMVLLHGGGTCYLGVLPTAKKIAEKYHVILLAYDGFNPSEPETEFRSVAWEARELEDYILRNYGGRVDILYGLSYGCRTLMQVLEDNRLQITTTIADGMSLRDYPDIKNEALKELYLFFFTGIFFVVMGRAGSELAELEKSGQMSDRQKDGLQRLCPYGYAHLVWDQGDCGQKAVRQPGRAESEGLSVHL